MVHVYIMQVCVLGMVLYCLRLQWNLSKMVTELGSHLSTQPASLVQNSTNTLQSTSVEQPPLYKGQLELIHWWLSSVSLYSQPNPWCCNIM